MISLPGNIYLLLIFIIFQGFLVLLVAGLFLEKIINTKRKKFELELIKTEAHSEAVRLLEEARIDSAKKLSDAHTTAMSIMQDSQKNAADILNKAQMQAADIVQKADFLKSELSANFNKTLEAFMSENMSKTTAFFNGVTDSVTHAVEQEKITSISGINMLYSDIKRTAEAGVSAYTKTLMDTTASLQTVLDKALQDKIAQMDKHINDLEVTKKAALESKLFTLAAEATYELVGHALTVNDKEDIIRKTIEKINFDQLK